MTNFINFLNENGVESFHNISFEPNFTFSFEAPCSIKWISIENDIEMGAFSYMVSGFASGVKIGRYVSIGENVQIGRHSHPTNWISTSPAFYVQDQINNFFQVKNFDKIEEFKNFSPKVPEHSNPLKHTNIKNDVYIGHGAIIMPGVTLNNGCIVGAGAVVTKDVPSYAIVAGNPANIIRFRFEENIILKLNKIKWWDYSPWDLNYSSIENVQEFITNFSKLNKNILKYKPKAITFDHYKNFKKTLKHK